MTAATRTKLIAAARHSFAKIGFAATSMDELCAEIGLTRGALYHHFGSKEGLFDAVVVAVDAEINAKLAATWVSTADSWEAFQTCCRTYLALALDPEIQRIVLKDAPAILGQRLREIDANSSLGPMTEGLKQLMVEDRIHKADPEALARLLNGAMVDAALWIAARDNPSDALDKAQKALDALLQGLTIRDRTQNDTQ